MSRARAVLIWRRPAAGNAWSTARAGVRRPRHVGGDLAPATSISRHPFRDRRTGTRTFLDLSHLDPGRSRGFPRIRGCASFGIDITKEPIPISSERPLLPGRVTRILEEHSGTSERSLRGRQMRLRELHGARPPGVNSLLDGALVFGRRVQCRPRAKPLDTSSCART